MKKTLGILLCLTGIARADCPNKPLTCALGAVGWQGTCWETKKLSCQPCGPKRCPEIPRKVPKTYSYPCVAIVQADKVQVDGCSNPLTDTLSSVYKQLFYAACVQHDTCYHNNIGIPKSTCDDDFKSNMAWTCRNYYTGTANQAQLGTCLAATETWYQTVSTVPIADQLWKSDHEWTAAHCRNGDGGKPARIPDTGPGPAKLPKGN